MRRPTLSATARGGARLSLIPEAGQIWGLHGQSEGRVGQVRIQVADARGEIDFELDPAVRGRGYASAAVRAAATWALDPDSGALASLLWRAEVGNWAARRVVWSCGFQVEGRVRGLLSDPSGRRDGWIGALLPGEPLEPLLAWLEPPSINLGEVVLRGHQPADAIRIFEACTEPSTRHFLDRLPDPYTLTDAEEFLLFVAEEHAGAAGLHFVIAHADEPDLQVGQISIMGLSGGLSRQAEIGYWAHPDSRRHGYTRTALRAVSRHALLPVVEGGLGLTRVFLRVAESNVGSAKVARDAGFVQSGRDRKAQRFADGSHEDQLRFDLLDTELEDVWAHPSALR